MKLEISQDIRKDIESHYESYMEAYPLRKKEVEEYLSGLEEDGQICMKFLYAFMAPNDILTYSAKDIGEYVKASLEMREEIAYAMQVPADIFLSYVLPYRVNNENLDNSRREIYHQIAPRLGGKTMYEAALEVNYWCYEKATYIPSDERTIAPLTMCKTARGRCGEESTLAVSAMRSVGIPSRQCYVPRWAHCDDNHAWVEVWIDGKWHYLGACEPEAVLDKGWFTAAASKAMLVHAKAYSNLFDGEDVAYRTPLYSLINSTKTYGVVKKLQARVLEDGVPKKGVNVKFQLVNYSELFTMYEVKTDENGYAGFETGMGDIYVYVEDGGRIVMGKIDARVQSEITLELTEGFLPETLKQDRVEEFDLVPPTEQVGGQQSEQTKQEHRARVAECEKIRSAYEKTFWQENQPYDGLKYGYREEESAQVQKALVNARGNREEIEKFAAMEEFQASDKAALLQTLREKDCADITAKTLAGYLRASLPYKGQYPSKIYQDYILAPRIRNEFLWDNRKKIQQIFEEEKHDPQSVLQYINQQIALVPEHGAGNWVADAAGMLIHKAAGKSSMSVLFVAVCRALGIPARLNPVTQKPEYIVIKEEQPVFCPVLLKDAIQNDSSDNETTKQNKYHKIILSNQEKEPIQYEYQFTIARFVDGDYKTLQYPEMQLSDQKELELEEGSYRLLTSARQLDGSVSARAIYFILDSDRDLPVVLREDQTAQKLKSESIPDITLKKEEKEENLHALIGGTPSVLIFADPGKEPTEHLFQELLECREQYLEKQYRMLILLSEKEGEKNPTLQRVLQTFPNAGIWYLQDETYFLELHQIMKVGDERLPFVIAVDENKKGKFAFANYNIRMAQTILKIFSC